MFNKEGDKVNTYYAAKICILGANIRSITTTSCGHLIIFIKILDRGILYKTPLSNVYINVQIEVYYFQTDLMYVNVNGVLYKIPLD